MTHNPDAPHDDAMTDQDLWKTDYPAWCRSKGISGPSAAPADRKQPKPLTGQRDFLEPGPDPEFRLTGEPRRKRRRK